MIKKADDVFLQIDNLHVSYQSEGKKIYAVKGVSLTLEKGKTLALVGETGAGKTTIAKAILRVLPDHGVEIEDGSVFMDGRDLLKISEKEMLKVRGAKIAMIFQDPMTALNPSMKVGPQIAEAVKEHDHVTKIQAMERAKEMLKLVGIQPDRYNEYPHQFSGGMKQRVVIAMALACNPELLLADEPTTALDVTIQAQVMALIKDLKKRYNTSLILITHDLGVVANISDDVAVIYAGEVLEYGSKEKIFRHPSHPYTIGLFNAIPDLEHVTQRLANIPGLPPDPSELSEGCCFCPRCEYARPECSTEKIGLIEIEDEHFCSCVYWNNLKKE